MCRPGFVEPLLKCPTLVCPTVVVVRGSHVRSDACKMWRLSDCRQILCGANVRSTEHPHFSVRVRERGCPFHSVVTVIRFVLECVELTFRSVPAAHVLNDHNVSAGRATPSKAAGAGLVVRGTLQQYREFAVGFRPVNVGAKCDAIPHFDGYIVFERDLVGLTSQTGGHHERATNVKRIKRRRATIEFIPLPPGGAW